MVWLLKGVLGWGVDFKEDNRFSNAKISGYDIIQLDADEVLRTP